MFNPLLGYDKVALATTCLMTRLKKHYFVQVCFMLDVFIEVLVVTVAGQHCAIASYGKAGGGPWEASGPFGGQASYHIQV
jgi:hypothetical protein